LQIYHPAANPGSEDQLTPSYVPEPKFICSEIDWSAICVSFAIFFALLFGLVGFYW
jgi:hypothetical protein